MALYLNGSKVIGSLVTDGDTGGGGMPSYDKLIDYALCSQPRTFIAVPLPSNYTDYTHLFLFVVQADTDHDYFDFIMPAIIDYYAKNGYLPENLGVVKAVADITSSSTYIAIPILSGSKLTINVYMESNINTTNVAGYNYNLAWQNLYLVAYGFNLS